MVHRTQTQWAAAGLLQCPGRHESHRDALKRIPKTLDLVATLPPTFLSELKNTQKKIPQEILLLP
jgi:hypothetical protein